jgi:hypothetical protein
MKRITMLLTVILFSLMQDNAVSRTDDVVADTADSGLRTIMLVDITLEKDLPSVTRIKLIQGRFNQKTRDSTGSHGHSLHLLNKNGDVLFNTKFNFPDKKTIPPAESSGHTFSSGHYIQLEQQAVSLVLPYLPDACYIEIISPVNSVPAYIKTIDWENLTIPMSSHLQQPNPAPARPGKFTIMIMASGYDLDTIRTFTFKANELKAYLLTKEPFFSRADSVDINLFENYSDLGCAPGCFGIDHLMCCDMSSVTMAAVLSGYLFDEIIILHNTDTYAGSGYTDNSDEYKTNSYSTYCVVYSGGLFKQMALHEFGHSFGSLGDEYSYTTVLYEPSLTVNCRPDCADWAGTGEMGCQTGCGASEGYSRPGNSIMFSLEIEQFNKASLYADYLPDGLFKRLEYFTDVPASQGGLTQTQVSQLYVSIFGRASEGEGNTYWSANQQDMTIAADTMLATGAAKSYFGSTLNDNQMFIEFIYKNTLGKTITEDPNGVYYWTGELLSGKSKGEVVANLINAAMDPQYSGLSAQDQFINKVEVSDYTADTITKVTDVTDLSAFVNFISDVTHDSSTVTEAKAAVDAMQL